MKNKITAVILSLALILTMLGSLPAFAVSETADTTAMAHLLNLGIVDEEFVQDADFVLTRGRFAALTAAMTGLPAGGSATTFTDVNQDTPYSQEIASCVTAGYIHGYEDGTFRPEQPVTGVEAAKIFIILAGYYPNAYYKGGYAAGILRVANQLDLFSRTGITNPDAYLTNQQAAAMALNILLTEFCAEIAYDTEGDVTYAGKGITVAEQYLDVIFDRGILQANGLVKVEEVDQTEGMLTINKVQYLNDNVSFMELLGHHVEYFYDKETKRAISVVSDPDKSRTAQFRVSEIDKIDGNRISYIAEDDTTQTATISADAVYLLNGTPLLDFDLSTLQSMANTELYLVGNQGNKSYQIVFINQYTDIIVGRKATDGTVTDRFDGNKSVVLDEEKSKKPQIILDAEGNVLQYEDIAEDHVISVLQGSNFIRVRLSKKLAAGTLDKIYDDKVNISGTEYTISSSYKTDALKLGTEVTGYLNVWDEIIYVREGVSAALDYGYLYRCTNKQSAFTSELLFKIYTIDGEMKEYTAAGTIGINDDRVDIDKLNGIPAQLLNNQGEFQSLLIGYIADEKGKITKIVTPQPQIDAGKYGFYQPVVKTKTSYYASTNLRCFGGVHFCTDDTVFMQVPDPNGDTDEELFDIFTRESLMSTSYTVDVYYFNSGSEFADVVIFYGLAQKVGNDSKLAVFQYLYESVNAEGEQVYEVEYFVNGAVTTSYVDEEIYARMQGMEYGDAFRFAVDKENYLTAVTWAYDREDANGEGALLVSSGSYSSSVRVTAGYAASVGNKVMRISPTETFNTDSSLLQLEGLTLVNPVYTVVEGKDGEIVRAGTKADIAIGDKVVVQTRSGVPRFVIIYKSEI